jgi:hypothetical protein
VAMGTLRRARRRCALSVSESASLEGGSHPGPCRWDCGCLRLNGLVVGSCARSRNHCVGASAVQQPASMQRRL